MRRRSEQLPSSAEVVSLMSISGSRIEPAHGRMSQRRANEGRFCRVRWPKECARVGLKGIGGCVVRES